MEVWGNVLWEGVMAPGRCVKELSVCNCISTAWLNDYLNEAMILILPDVVLVLALTPSLTHSN